MRDCQMIFFTVCVWYIYNMNATMYFNGLYSNNNNVLFYFVLKQKRKAYVGFSQSSFKTKYAPF